MYQNIICMKCGKTIPFQSVVPYSVDKVVDGWNLIIDEVNHQTISVRGCEIASICSVMVQENKATKRKTSSKIKVEK